MFLFAIMVIVRIRNGDVMDEFSFIDSIKQSYYRQSSLIKGIDDDAAVFRTTDDIVTSVDTFVNGIHFSNKTMELFHVGYRVLAANISDMAAMGAIPTFYLVSVVIPKSISVKKITEVFRGMEMIAKKYQMDLIGGDTVSGNEMMITVTVIGYVKNGMARYRSVSKEDDIVFVTGTLGDAQAGLHILLNDLQIEAGDYFIKRHRMPSPRVEFAKGLEQISRVALNDISDGLASEANEIAEASNVTLVINDNAIPVVNSFSQFSADLQRKWKYFGGEDFELLGTVSINEWDKVLKIGKETNTNVTKIGYVTTKKANSVYVNDQTKQLPLWKKGYNHLSR